MGQKIENIVLNILEEIFLINSLPKTIKEPAFQNLNAKNELLKLLIRLCFELNLIGSNQYLIFEEKIQEIGKMIGGWIKYVRNE